MTRNKITKTQDILNMRPAGLTGRKDEVGAKGCLVQAENNQFLKKSMVPPRELEKPMPKSRKEVTEKTAGLVHGLKNIKLDGANDVLSPKQAHAVLEKLVLSKEEKYNRKEFHPLGHHKDHGISLPESTQDAEFRFGVKGQKSDDMKEIVHPELPNDDLNPEVHALYKRSHHDYIPGEKKDYRYTVPEKNVKDSAQIVALRKSENGKHAKLCMSWIPEEELEKKYVNEKLKNYKEKYQFSIGQVRDPLKDTMKVPETHVFGLKNPKTDANLFEIMKHPAPPAKLTDQVNNTELTTEFMKEAREKKGFGAPSVWTRQVETLKKLDDKRSYADELGAGALISPTALKTYKSKFTKAVESRLKDQQLSVYAQKLFAFERNIEIPLERC